METFSFPLSDQVSCVELWEGHRHIVLWLSGLGSGDTQRRIKKGRSMTCELPWGGKFSPAANPLECPSPQRDSCPALEELQHL